MSFHFPEKTLTNLLTTDGYEVPEISELDLNPIFALAPGEGAASWMPESG